MKETRASIRVLEMIDRTVTLILSNDEFLRAINKKQNKELCDAVMEMTGVCARQAQKYIKRARERIHEMTEDRKEELFNKAVQKKEYLFRLALGNDDYKAAQIIHKDLCELQGLYPAKKINEDKVDYSSIDLSKFSKHGLERIKRGDEIRDVMLDPESYKAA